MLLQTLMRPLTLSCVHTVKRFCNFLFFQDYYLECRQLKFSHHGYNWRCFFSNRTNLAAPPSLPPKVNMDLSSLLDSEDKKSKNKRGVLPKHATNIMRSWLFQHLMVRLWRSRSECVTHSGQLINMPFSETLFFNYFQVRFSFKISSQNVHSDFCLVSAPVSNRGREKADCGSDKSHPAASQQLVRSFTWT